MKKRMFIVLLLCSIGLNIYLINYKEKEITVKETYDLSIGISETYELLFDQMNLFHEKYSDYSNDEIELEEFEIYIDMTSKNVGRLYNILDSFHILENKELEPFMALEEYYYSFIHIENEVQFESLQDIEKIIQKNSNLTVAMIYSDDESLNEGETPKEMANFSSDLNAVLEGLDLNYYK